MNSMEIVQQAITAWLKVPDQTSMDAASLEEVLRCLNGAQGQVWRALPTHYKRQTISLDFYGTATGTVTPAGYGLRTVTGVAFPTVMDVLTFLGEPIFYEGEPLLFNEANVYENPRPYCSILVSGDATVNQFNGTALVHPYLGTGSGQASATLYHDAALCSVMIERLISPLVDRITGREWEYVTSHPFRPCGGRNRYSIRRLLYSGSMRTLVELTPQHDTPVILTGEVLVAPVPLTLGSSQRAVDLVYDTEVAGFIVAAAGTALSTHPFFDRERVSYGDTANAAANVFSQIGMLSPMVTNQLNQIGTPCGY